MMHGLSQIHMNRVEIWRSLDLKQMSVEIRLDIGNLTLTGLHNTKGHLGTAWLQFPMNSRGDQPFEVVLTNSTIIPSIKIDAEAPCDPERNIRITEFQVPLKYDGVVSG